MAIKEVILSIMSSLKMNSSDYCDLETVAGTDTLVFKDSSMMTLLRYDGMLSQVSRRNFVIMVDQMASRLNNAMSNSGYKIICIFRKDLDAFSSLQRIEAIKKQTAQKLHLALNDIIEESIDTARTNVYDEEVYFALVTSLNALDAVDRETLKNRKPDPDLHVPKIPNAQNLLQPIDLLHSKHNEFVERFIGSFQGSDFYVSIEKVNVLKALSFIRHQAQPNSSPREWTPVVAIGSDYMRHTTGVTDYRSPIFFPNNDDLEDQSYWLPPSLPRQLLSQEIEVLGADQNMPPNTIRSDGRLYASVFMDIPPTQPSLFNELFAAFNNASFHDSRGRLRSMPWSLSVVITGDGLAGSMTKKIFKEIIGMLPPSTNANMRAAYNQLEYLKRNDKAVVGLQISAMTWVDDDGSAKSREQLIERKNRLKHYTETWGQMKVIDNVGDPVLGWRSNLLGMTNTHVGTKGATPLAEALAMLPITRPASAFNNGTVINRTLDGKLMKLEKFSSEQNTWVKCITGGPGSGKSVMLNNDLLETCLMGGLERLPLITVIDKGESSSGFVELIRDSLPNHLKHYAVNKKLRKEKEYSINPFDIKVGLTEPLNDEKTQMESFLVALLTPAERQEPYTDTTSFVSQLIAMLFESIQEGREGATPKVYKYNANRELDRYIIENEIIEFEKDGYGRPNYLRPLEKISYFALVRKLHQRGNEFPSDSEGRELAWRARDLAHRLAMPTLMELDNILNSPRITDNFTNTIADTGETMPNYAKRAISSAITAYPCFAYPTQFDVDTARVVSLDLQDVVSKQNPKQSSLFVQIARTIATKKIGLSSEDIKSPLISPMFRKYYEQKFQELNGDRKVLAIDEMHNYRGNTTLMGLLEVDAREGRKWGVELIFASQNVADFYFPDRSDGKEKIELLNFVTHMCLCKKPEGDDLVTFRKYFDPKDENTGSFRIPSRTLESIRLDSNGLTYLSTIKTKTKKYTQLLTLEVGPKLLWSLTTTAEDRLIRNYMYKLTNGNRTRGIAALAYHLPSGAKRRIDDLRNQMKADKADDDEIESKANELVANLATQALTVYDLRVAQDRERANDY